MTLTMKIKLSKSLLSFRVFIYSWRSYGLWLLREWCNKRQKHAPTSTKPPPSLSLFSDSKQDQRPRNIVIAGASFAGYHAARLIVAALPPDSPFRVVIIEPNSHFNFIWILPRLCVVKGHEHKAFIPYGPHLEGAAEVRWVRDRVVSVSDSSTVVIASGEEVPFEFLVLATGSGAGDELPSRVGVQGKTEGMRRLRAMQTRIEGAARVLVVGGGAAGVELATDVKGLYPEKGVVLVHSRQAVMNRFGPELQAAALDKLRGIGVTVLLGERVVQEDGEAGVVMLKSGTKLESDCIINCTGQKPNSSIVTGISPSSIDSNGFIKVTPTLQIDDAALPNIFVCGDVAATGEQNPNARSAMRAAMVVADNILRATKGNEPRYKYRSHWADALIKLTLGLEDSITHYSDGKTEILREEKETDLALMSSQCWTYLGAKPFEDPDFDSEMSLK